MVTHYISVSSAPVGGDKEPGLNWRDLRSKQRKQKNRYTKKQNKPYHLVGQLPEG